MREQRQYSLDATGRQQMLLSEYQGAVAHVEGAGGGWWQATSISAGGGIAAIAVLVSVGATTANAIAASAVAVGGVVLFELWLKILNRQVAALRATEVRLREIERELGLRRNIYLNILAKGEDYATDSDWEYLLTPQEKTKFGEGKMYKPLPGQPVTAVGQCIVRMLQIGFILVAAGKWIEVCTN